MSDIVVIGGPNGAGKTTAAKALLPEIDIDEFVNADEIARRQSFAFETTCSGRAYAPLLRRCRDDGWKIGLLFLWSICLWSTRLRSTIIPAIAAS